MLLDLLAPPLCWACRAPAARGAALCRACRRSLRFLGGRVVAPCGLPVWAPVAYAGPARDLVKALKYNGAGRIADEMAALIVANAPADHALAAAAAATLVPVPLHPARLRARPFNQAALLAHAVAARTGLTVADCLRRAGPAGRQVGRGRAARLGGLAGTVEANTRAPPSALLVDDVVTTGATLAACAAALRAAGAERVEAIAFARTAAR